MTRTYDPKHERYVDEADVRTELTRVFDLCRECRRCVDLCASFPTLFEMLDHHDEPDAGLLTPAQQDRVVDACYQCKRCTLDCPYVAPDHPSHLDFPRSMLRATAMQHANGIMAVRDRWAAQVLGRTGLVGRLATGAIGNRVANAAPGSMVRRLVAAVTGVSSTRRFPRFARQRFSTWFARRPRISLTGRQGRVTVFPTCLVEFQDVQIGQDLVKVYERNGIECAVTGAGCCGAPWLHSGNVAAFAEVAARNVAILAAEIRAGTDVVVPQPGCSHVIRSDYLDHVGGHDAVLVAEHTHDATSYLLDVHTGEHTSLDTDFDGETVDSISYHAPRHVRAQSGDLDGRDLMKLTGARVRVVGHSAGAGGLWSCRAAHDAVAVPIAEQLGARITAAGDDLVAGDCSLANAAIVERTGRAVSHPLQVLARAYGIAEE